MPGAGLGAGAAAAAVAESPTEQAPDGQLPQLAQQDVLFETVEGELVLWRVFGLSDVFEDRPVPSWTIEEDRGPEPADRLRTSIGDVPEDLHDALIE